MTMLTRRTNDVFPITSMIDRFFGEPFFAPDVQLLGRVEEGMLPLDVSEDEKDIVVRANLPGFVKENIEIEVHDGVLGIKATAQDEKEEKSERFYRKERRMSSVNRRVALPSAVQETAGKAEFKDGVLTLRLPKIAKEQPKKIRIG